jgi:hypothetical protein
MKTIISISLLSFLVAFTGYSQKTKVKNNGYYGKRTFFDLSTVISVPLFSNVFTDNTAYKKEAAGLSTGKDYFNYGFRISIGHASKRNFAVLFEYGQDYSNIYPNNYIQNDYSGSFNYVYANIKHQMMDVKTNIFMPKLEFATKNSLLPMGLSHQIGLGYSKSKIALHEYTYLLTGEDENGVPLSGGYKKYDAKDQNNQLFNSKRMQPVNKFIILYALNLRSPISKSLMINYGIRYTLQFGRYNSYANSGDGTYLDEKELLSLISRQRSFSFMSFHIGLTLAL